MGDKGEGRGWRPSAQDGGAKPQVVRRRTHLSVVLGITFCVIGGAVMASALVLGWSTTAAGEESLWDLWARGGVFLLAPLVPICGILAAVISSLDVLAEKGRRRMKGPSAIGAMAAALLGIIAMAVVALGINQDIMNGDASAFGPALFMSVFGGVLALSGGMILAIDYLEARSRRGRFTASGGSEELRRALRPAARPKPRTEGKTMRAAPAADEPVAAYEAPRSTGLECPNCYSPVQPNWSICPICGEELLSS